MLGKCICFYSYFDRWKPAHTHPCSHSFTLPRVFSQASRSTPAPLPLDFYSNAWRQKTHRLYQHFVFAWCTPDCNKGSCWMSVSEQLVLQIPWQCQTITKNYPQSPESALIYKLSHPNNAAFSIKTSCSSDNDTHCYSQKSKHTVTSAGSSLWEMQRFVFIYSTHGTGQIWATADKLQKRIFRETKRGNKGTQTNGHSRLCVTSGCRQSEEVEEEEGSRMVFFGQLREAEPDRWSAPSLALRDEGQGHEIQQKMIRTTMRLLCEGKHVPCWHWWSSVTNTFNFTPERLNLLQGYSPQTELLIRLIKLEWWHRTRALHRQNSPSGKLLQQNKTLLKITPAFSDHNMKL